MRIGSSRFRAAQSLLDQSRMGCCLYTDSFMLNVPLAWATPTLRRRSLRQIRSRAGVRRVFEMKAARPLPSSAASGSERMCAALLICLVNITIITLLF
ncbi:hypothetical protein QQF64_001404 [Cirrhinus molitorella]|uniref:Uncharacterized protein n=1 Tax=Cirrhinus molitorella TaxID=172907 RepID=A0ABR3P0K5_9TELE